MAFSADAMVRLQAHAWPGNVRELKNLAERLVIMTPAHTIETRHLPAGLLKPNGAQKNPAEARSLSEARMAFDRDYILKKLEENRGNISRTAEALGIERSHLHRKLKSLKITVSRGSVKTE